MYVPCLLHGHNRIVRKPLARQVIRNHLDFVNIRSTAFDDSLKLTFGFRNISCLDINQAKIKTIVNPVIYPANKFFNIRFGILILAKV